MMVKPPVQCLDKAVNHVVWRSGVEDCRNSGAVIFSDCGKKKQWTGATVECPGRDQIFE